MIQPELPSPLRLRTSISTYVAFISIEAAMPRDPIYVYIYKARAWVDFA